MHQALNAKLVTHPLSDPFFSMLNSFVGETSRADRMLLNLLPANSGNQVTGISSNAPFWSKSDQAQVNNSREVVSLNITDCHNIERQTIRSSKFEIYGDDIKLITWVIYLPTEGTVTSEKQNFRQLVGSF